MSAITADGANAPSHLPQMQAVATQSNGPHQVKYVLTRGPNNAIRASPAMPNTPIITIRQEGGTLRATTSAQGQVQFVHNGQQYVSSSHHVGGNPMQSHLARRDVAVGHLNSVNVPSTVNVTGGNTGVPLLLRKVDPISQQLQASLIYHLRQNTSFQTVITLAISKRYQTGLTTCSTESLVS